MATVVRGYKTGLDLNNEQRTACLKHAGCARFAYNWGLVRKQAAYKAGGKAPSAIDLHRELNALKQSEYPWIYEVSKCAMQEALRDLETAYKCFYHKLKLKAQGKFHDKVGYPRFKKRSKAIAITHARIAHIRKDSAHTLTCFLTKNHALVAIEDLHVAGMLKNHCLAQAVADSNFGEIRRQLEYKAAWRGVQIVTVNRFYPSSKTCSSCGCVKPELSLSERVFVCEVCGLVLDRDLNAALNVRNVAGSSLDTQNACGQGSSGYLATDSETALVEAGTK